MHRSEIKMNKHRIGLTYEKYVGNTKKGRHEHLKVVRKKMWKCLDRKMHDCDYEDDDQEKA